MVRNLFVSFIGLVVLFFVIRYPGDIIALLQLFVNAASKIANSLQSLVHSVPSQASSTSS
jgi:hypothetical protein